MNILETSVLSGCLTELIPKIVDKVRPEFFEESAHTQIFKHFLAFYSRSGRAFSKDAFAEYSKDLNPDERLKYGLVLEQLNENVDRALVMVRLDQFIKAYKKREIQSIREDIGMLEVSTGDDVRTTIEKKLLKLSSIENKPIDSYEFTSKEALDKLTGILKKAKESKGLGIKTGITELDDVLYGGFPGDLWTYCAPSSHGKSTMLMNHAYYAVVHQGKNVVFASSEMGSDQCLTKFYALHAFHLYKVSIDLRRLRGEGLNEKEEELLMKAADHLINTKSHGKIHFCLANGGQTIVQIHQFCEDLNKTCPLDAVFVDYFDKLGPLTKDKNLRHDVIKGETYSYAKGQFAIGFNNGQGIFVCTAHQANTEGAKQGAFNEGVFKKETAADTASAYRLPDVFISIFKTCEIVKKGEDDENFKAFKTESVMAILKSRDGGQTFPFIPKFFIDVNPQTGGIKPFDAEPPSFVILPTEDKDLELGL